MFGKSLSNHTRFAALFIIVLSILLLFTATVSAQTCKKVNGHFTLQVVTGVACTSPVGICTTRDYRGGIRGTSVFTASTLIQTVDTPTTSVVLVTGDNLVQSSDGNLITKDAIVLQTSGSGFFAEVDTTISGTGQWTGATGTISAVGTFSSSSGGEGTYSGEICTP